MEDGYLLHSLFVDAQTLEEDNQGGMFIHELLLLCLVAFVDSRSRSYVICTSNDDKRPILTKSILAILGYMKGEKELQRQPITQFATSQILYEPYTAQFGRVLTSIMNLEALGRTDLPDQQSMAAATENYDACNTTEEKRVLTNPPPSVPHSGKRPRKSSGPPLHERSVDVERCSPTRPFHSEETPASRETFSNHPVSASDAARKSHRTHRKSARTSVERRMDNSHPEVPARKLPKVGKDPGCFQD